MALTAMLERLPELQRADDAPLEPMRGILLLGPAHLALKFRPGRPAGASFTA